MFGLDSEWSIDLPPRYHTLEDYEGGIVKWCPGCGDFAVLTAVQRVCRDAQLAPEKTVFVSGIGCSSRFPHYMNTYGFHGLHGRALPVACGVKSRRPDLDVWVATGDGDCCSIGAGHWIHAVRYNMNLVVLLFDNSIYGLTKKQTSPTTPMGIKTNTHPEGGMLPPLNPLQATLGFTNVSFVAQTVDWNPAHLLATVAAAHAHRGLSFVRILQRCPAFVPLMYEEQKQNPEHVLCLDHQDGVQLDPAVGKLYENHMSHDPLDMDEARKIASTTDKIPIGILYQNRSLPCYEEYTTEGMDIPLSSKVEALEAELDRFAV